MNSEIMIGNLSIQIAPLAEIIEVAAKHDFVFKRQYEDEDGITYVFDSNKHHCCSSQKHNHPIAWWDEHFGKYSSEEAEKRFERYRKENAEIENRMQTITLEQALDFAKRKGYICIDKYSRYYEFEDSNGYRFLAEEKSENSFLLDRVIAWFDRDYYNRLMNRSRSTDVLDGFNIEEILNG